MRQVDTIVVGAGLSGLTAADAVRRAGRSVLVLEGSERVGGRIVRMQRGQDCAEAGAQGIHNNYTEMLGILARLDLAKDLRPSSGKVQYLGRGGERHLSGGNADLMRILGPRGAADLIQFRTRYFTFARKFRQFEIARDIPQYDNVMANEALSWAGPQFTDFVLRPMMHAMCNTRIDQTNLYHVINSLRLRLTTRISSLRTGNVTVCEKLAETLPVQLGSPVERVLTTKGRADGVLLADGRTLGARHVIVATTIGAAGAMTPDEFGPAKAFLNQFRYSPMPLVMLFLDRPQPSEAYAYMGHPFHDAIFNMAIDHSRKTPFLVPSGKSIISAWPAFPNTAAQIAKSDSEIIGQALKDLEPQFPGVASQVEEARVMRHGWAVANYRPGAHRRILDFKAYASRLPGISYAGNDYDGVHMESGVRSAQRAAARSLQD
jgi:protoporphyrinogen oxidase